MSDTNRGRGRLAVTLVLVVIAGLAGVIVYRVVNRRPGEVAHAPATAPATAPVTQPVTRPVDPPGPPPVPQEFIDVVRLAYPDLPATRPLAVPLKISEAARLVINDPVYLGPPWRQEMWITRPDAAPTPEVLNRALDPEQDVAVHVTRERVAYAHWSLTPAGRQKLQLVVERPAGGGYEVVSLSGRRPLPQTGRRYEWDRAMSVDDWLVVPADHGVSAFHFDPDAREQFFDLRDPKVPDEPQTRPQILFAGQGVLTWLPWENGKVGGRAALYTGTEWVDLGRRAEWGQRIVHLMPLLDGSVLQIVAAPEGDAKAEGEGQPSAAAKVQITLTGPPQGGGTAAATTAPGGGAGGVNEQEVETLVLQLSDPDREKRDAAFKALTRYGPGVYPVLQRLSKTAPPEAASRLRQLLRMQVRPTLGGMNLVGERLQLVMRQPDGGAVFYAPGGVAIPQEQGPPMIQPAAWVAVRPGRAVEVLPRSMTVDLNPDQTKVWSVGNEWIVAGDVRGPRWWIGNGLVPLLRRSDTAFSELVGRDRRGRWVFRKPADTGSDPSSRAMTTTQANPPQAGDGPTLVIDPTLPDPTPRLPVWEYKNAEVVGWDKDNWPAATYAEGDWILHETGWKAMPEEESIRSRPDQIPPLPIPPVGTQPSTPLATTTSVATQTAGDAPSSAPSTSPAHGTLGPPIGVAADGTRYYDGRSSLHVVKPDGHTTVWPLPPAAQGQGKVVTLIPTAGGRLFLFNEPGRVLRIKPTPEAAEPFALEATFSRGVPSIADPTRIWLDPAGRIVMAYGARLAILFPQGYIPPRIQELMDPQDLELFAEE